MDLSREFHPIHKPRNRTYKKQKKPQTHKGRVIPKKGVRGRFTKKDIAIIFDVFGESCNICGGHNIEIHHVMFKSRGGRRGWRNGMPLCNKCHTKAHRHSDFADSLIEDREDKYGPDFYKDEFDLFTENKISSPTKELFERYMNSYDYETGKYGGIR